MISGSKNLPRKSACHCLTAARHHLILYWCHKDEHILPLKHPKCFGGLVGGCKYALPGKWADPVKVADELGGRLYLYQPTADDVVPHHEGAEGGVLALFLTLGTLGNLLSSCSQQSTPWIPCGVTMGNRLDSCSQQNTGWGPCDGVTQTMVAFTTHT